jgi:hypothetical protein
MTALSWFAMPGNEATAGAIRELAPPPASTRPAHISRHPGQQHRSLT